ncbi:hypothetical protein FJR38_26035 [Anabaena sp. UHCC 0253]|uniref:B12-binding domain-containing radical SAM protein n=1 Tax=Anabaena sp. UHCC 0253 TaxID=2590019 RepID=UPI001445E716|nr:cobalamin-dependent protein [Anabaena sp. UHCC 0253]MTJ55874.1 hypothetical protein [Anabaena sp. UHCC 0253]
MQILEILKSEWKQISNILDFCGKSPDFFAKQIQEIICSRYSSKESDRININVAGSPDMPIVCVYDKEYLVICSKDNNLEFQPFVVELQNNFKVVFQVSVLDDSKNYFGKFLTIQMSKDLEKRLVLPSVLLVSLFHPEMYPTPRLTLGIAYIASFLRLQNHAKVSIIDCQFGSTVDDVIKLVKNDKPDIIGISVNFGQYDLMEELLDKVYAIFDIDQEPVIELGNILASMCFREILDKYPRVVIGKQEGEGVLVHLVKNLKDRSKWHNIPGICYKDLQTGKIVETCSELLLLNQLPAPALDTIEDLFNNDGVMTAEFSRGCQYNVCSFCPRSHKGNLWRSLPIESMVKQWNFFARVFNQFQKKPHIFFADEEFIGKRSGYFFCGKIKLFLELSFRYGN